MDLEKGFRQEEKNFRSIEGKNMIVEPYSRTNIYSDRYFATLGFGYRKEILGRIFIGFECEYGVISSVRISQHYTFNPQFYNGLPAKYLIDQLINRSESNQNSEFQYILIYTGIIL